jgi:hypothetical protein
MLLIRPAVHCSFFTILGINNISTTIRITTASVPHQEGGVLLE